jgi:hypothetical protein
MQMEHSEYIKLQTQLQDHFDGRYRKIDDCDVIVDTEEKKIDKLNNSIADLKVEQAKTNTRLGILIGILSTIGVPIIGICVKLLFQ